MVGILPFCKSTVCMYDTVCMIGFLNVFYHKAWLRNGALLFVVCECLPACMSVHHMHAWCPQNPEEDVRSPETGIGQL